MINPLTAILPTEDRGDGVYIKVTRDAAAALSSNAIVKTLESALVLNFDAGRIAEVIKNSHGIFEKIGPPFQYYDAAIEQYVHVGMTPMKAIMKLSSLCLTDNIRPTATGLIHCLNRKGVRYGIKTDVVGDIVRDAAFDKEIIIAEGKNPVAGLNAKIVMEVDVNHNFKPQQKTDGTVDYRTINSITQVKNGQVIAKKIPPTKGEPGHAVSGQEITPVPGNDGKFTGGKNTRVSDDGLYLLATKSGFIYLEGDVIHVGEVLPIPKDVDFSVGNIKYSGDIQITGSVLPGFTVETEGNVDIHGQVESARIISRGGGVEIHKGIIGKGDAFISGKTGVKTEFSQDATIKSEGAVVINKFCMHSEITCDVLEIKSPHSNLIGGLVRAFSHIEAFSVGNEKGVVTKICLVDKNELANREKLKELELLKKKLGDALEPVKKQLKTKAAILKTMGSPTDRAADELKKWLGMYNDLTLKMKYVDNSIVDVNAKLKNPVHTDGFIKIIGTVYPGTELGLYGVVKPIKEPMINKVFRLQSGAVETEG
jgi:uncharacterized protein (DUF342 family)